MKDDKTKNPLDFGEQILEKIGDSLNDMDFGGLSETIRTSVDYIRQEAEKGYKKEKVKKALPVLRKIPGRVKGPIEIGFGIASLLVFGGLSIGFGITALVISMAGSALSAASIALLCVFLSLTGVGGGFLGHGISSNKRAKRLTKYQKILQGKEYLMLESLSEKSEEKIDQIRKDIKYIIENKLAPDLSMDKKGTCLLLTDGAREQYLAAEQARIQREKDEKKAIEEEAYRNRQKEEGTKQEREWIYFQEACNDFLTELQQRKKEIDTPIMQEHISKVELLLSQIFVCIKEHPEMVLSTGHLASYYLPCMSKLLSTYEDLEEQPIQGENIKKTKQEIEVSFETIEAAMTNMYDELFKELSMDISSDIQVLKAMMAQDGWSNKPGNK